jgi:hypothetical protein
MPQVEYEPMIPVFERANTVRALNRATTVIGVFIFYPEQIYAKRNSSDSYSGGIPVECKPRSSVVPAGIMGHKRFIL